MWLRVYSLNRGIGFASSGVEYAQKYRAELLKTLPVDDNYVFLDYLSTNIANFTDLMGFSHQQTIWIYNYLSHRVTQSSTFTVDEFLQSIIDPIAVTERNDDNILIELNDSPVTYKIWLLKNGRVDRIDYLVNGSLIQVRHYDDTLNNVEDYNGGQVVRRVFYHHDQTIAFEQFYEHGRIRLTRIDGQTLYGSGAFFQYFIKQLSLTKQDMVIFDRALGVAEALLPCLSGKVRLVTVVHAEHYDEKRSVGNHFLWNNNYEYVFDYASKFEAFVVATTRQEQRLRAQLTAMLGPLSVKVVTIPVGFAEQNAPSSKFDPYKMITASRLASEKHLDVLITAVVACKPQLPALSLDIYGEGGLRQELNRQIQLLHAEGYIKLKGHQPMSGIYGHYGAYLSASTSEGFGLSLLEATAAGVPIIGVDVDYGNRTFIQNGQNGILYDRTPLNEMPEVVQQAIIQFYQQALDQTGRAIARKIGARYSPDSVRHQWQSLLLGEVGKQ